MNSEQVEQRACRRCRAPLGEQARYCEKCGAWDKPMEQRNCRACGTALGPASHFCAHCGARAQGPRAPGARAGWDHLRARAAATDWARVGRVALPAAGLFLAGLIGYALGQRDERPAASSTGVVSAARGWRADTPRAAERADPAPPGNVSSYPQTELRPEVSPQAVLEASPPSRFRDFQISASSWEVAHPPIHAADGDPYTFWHAWKSEKFSEGEWLTLTFPEERLITRIGLLPGRMGAGARAEGRVRSVLVKAGDATPQKLLFEDRPAVQYRNLKEPVRTRKLILRIGTVLPGRETRHIVVPEVQVWGHPASS